MSNPHKKDFEEIDNHFYYPDGDQYQIYAEVLENGNVRISEKGNFIMRLSYCMDIDILDRDDIDKIIKQILVDTEVKYKDGEFYIDALSEDKESAVFFLITAITRIHAITYWRKELMGLY